MPRIVRGVTLDQMHLAMLSAKLLIINRINRIRKFWQRTRDPAVKSEFLTLSREVTKDIRHFFQSRWESHIAALTPETGTLWRKISLFKKPPQNIPLLNGSLGSVANHPLEKAEVITDSLQKQFEPNTEAENDRFTARTQMKIKRFLDAPTCLDLEKSTPGEVQEYIKKLKINKSPRLDLITNRILKNPSLKFVLFIVMLFNLLMENCHFPKNWKTAVVVPILKPNSDDTQPQNYRPISLLSSLSKEYEFILLNRLNQHCIARNIIIFEQHGFFTQCSTVAQLLRVTELIHHGFQNNQAMGMLFVDIVKVFDKIWHDGLLSKMMLLGFSNQLIKIIHSYLNSREFRERVENSLSTPRPILSGVPQESLLGPKLFNLYINDIPKAVGVHLAMYADNTAIFTQNIYNCYIIEQLQNYVIRLELMHLKEHASSLRDSGASETSRMSTFLISLSPGLLNIST
ncbi:RNA-directed DNA polymerase from mobile element jockey [Trichonephila clavipes]|nr:RNA-directed DNA polymerase from mobile element jockey [Trichonephila clavipes]